ncbi:MAG: galactokinase [Blastocatellia bacterium]
MNVTAMQGQFGEMFGAAARIWRAPGRINLIGEHTDYNDGFVMPAAIDAAVCCAIAPRADRRLVIHSVNMGETVERDLDALTPARHWSDYPAGVAAMLERAGLRLPGANLLIEGNVPPGAGLSSSAAIEVAAAYALLDMAGRELPPAAVARICQMAESEFAGLRCGIMDQFIACHGRAGQAILLDCRTLTYRWLPLPASVRFVVCNTMIRHELAGSEYNLRRADCETGVRQMSALLPGVTALRDVTPADLATHGHALPDRVRRRCHHVISENARTLAAAEMLERGDLAAFGQLLNASHASLRDDYDVSCPELDLLAALAWPAPGVYGARMMGGGFGGCTINLVEAAHADDFARNIAADYQRRTGVTPEITVCTAADGAGRIV